MAESEKAIYAALAGNTAVATTKMVAAAFTGSSAMFSEGMHSVVDAANEGLLLFGQHRSRRPPDEAHPFGHGQELYFWTLIVSLVIFAAGGAVSAYEGILGVLDPRPPDESVWNFIVLGAAAVFEGASFFIGVHQFRKAYPNQGFWHVVKTSKDPPLFTVIFEDAADVAGLAVAFAGVWLSGHLGTSLYDGIAAIVIGVLLMGMSLVLVRESRGLLTGEAADPQMRRHIRAILESDDDVDRVNPPLTMYFGPEMVLLAVEIQFRGGLTSGDVARAVARLEDAVRAAYPKVKRIFIEANSIRAAEHQPEPS